MYNVSKPYDTDITVCARLWYTTYTNPDTYRLHHSHLTSYYSKVTTVYIQRADTNRSRHFNVLLFVSNQISSGDITHGIRHRPTPSF